MSKPRPGKNLEAEVRLFFKSSAWPAWSHGFDDIGASDARCPRCSQPVSRLNARRPADRIACWKGLSVLVECKETSKTALPLENLQVHQERHLQAHQEAGGVSILVIRRNIPRAPLAWVVFWQDWPELLRLLEGRASIPLLDGVRPDCVRRLERRRLHDHDPGPTWDLSVYLDSVAARRLS